MIQVKKYIYSKGFTLIELLVVIAIIAIIVTLVMPNFLSARQRASDVKKKAEIAEFKNALRMYYNDYQRYPRADSGHTNIEGCDVNGNTGCPCDVTGADFAAGANCETVYMKSFPEDFSSSGTTRYWVAANGDDFCLVAALDNMGDKDLDTTQARCGTSCTITGTNHCTTGNFCMCAD